MVTGITQAAEVSLYRIKLIDRTDDAWSFEMMEKKELSQDISQQIELAVQSKHKKPDLLGMFRNYFAVQIDQKFYIVIDLEHTGLKVTQATHLKNTLKMPLKGAKYIGLHDPLLTQINAKLSEKSKPPKDQKAP